MNCLRTRCVVRAAAVLWLALLLAACAGITARDEQAAVPPFELTGRIVVSDEERRFTGSVRWLRADDVDDIWLGAPLGQTFAQVHEDASGATLTTADQTIYRAGSIEQLTQRAFGWRFPAAGLRQWVHGRPSPGADVTGAERDGVQRWLRFSEGGWRVTFAYREAGDARPSRVEAQSGGNAIRLVIDSFTAGPQ